MRFPLDAARQASCPGCKKKGYGKRSPAELPYPSASLDLFAGGAVSSLMLSWCPGADGPWYHGAVLEVVDKKGSTGAGEQLSLQFCSTACLRTFLNACVDELEKRVAKAVSRP